MGTGKSARAGYGRYFWDLNFKNETNQEIASVTLRMISEGPAGMRAIGKPVVFRRFYNSSIPHEGSMLPYNKTQHPPFVGFEIPLAQMPRGGRLGLSIVGVSVFQKPDLHDPGHLYTALYNGTPSSNLALLKRDRSLFKVKSTRGLTITLAAFGACDPQTIRYVLAHGGNPRDKTPRGSTIMHLASANRDTRALALALSVGGKIDQPLPDGRTPLMKAVAGGNQGAWRWLLAHKADPNHMTANGTPADFAILEGQDLALSDLVRAGAKRNLRIKDGSGWMQIAAYNYPMLDVVRRYGIPVDDRNPKTGETALMKAARLGKPQGVIWLVQHGANPTLKDRKGLTAYDYARKGGVNLGCIVSMYGPKP